MQCTQRATSPPSEADTATSTSTAMQCTGTSVFDAEFAASLENPSILWPPNTRVAPIHTAAAAATSTGCADADADAGAPVVPGTGMQCTRLPAETLDPIRNQGWRRRLREYTATLIRSRRMTVSQLDTNQGGGTAQ